MFAAVSDPLRPQRCNEVYCLDSLPVCDEAVGVWRERADRVLTSWVLPLEILQTSRKHTRRQTRTHWLDTQINKCKHWYTVWKCIVETLAHEWHAVLCVCLKYESVYFLSQWLCTYQADVIPNLPLYLTSSSLPSLFCLHLFLPRMSLSLFRCVF